MGDRDRAAPVAAVGFAFRELYTDAERLKKAGQDLAQAPLGEGIDVQRFADAQEKLEGVAEKAEDARKAAARNAKVQLILARIAAEEKIELKDVDYDRFIRMESMRSRIAPG